MDVLGAFLRECSRKDPDEKTGTQDLYKAYRVWCDDGGERPEGKRKFSSRLKERGFESRRSGANGSYEWQGVELLNFWKVAICRKTEPSEVEVPIDASKNSPRGDIGKNGSEGSEGSAQPLTVGLQTGGSSTLEQLQGIRELVYQGTAEHIARRQVLGDGE
jgi:phage/plasmid-associated DNA primase